MNLSKTSVLSISYFIFLYFYLIKSISCGRRNVRQKLCKFIFYFVKKRLDLGTLSTYRDSSITTLANKLGEFNVCQINLILTKGILQ